MRALEAEQKAIWLRRREVVAALSAAAAEGDRSENAEYIYRKKELRELDRRIRYLQKRLPELNVVAEKPATSRITAPKYRFPSTESSIDLQIIEFSSV